MDKVWTYEELTWTVEDKLLASASMLDVVPPNPATLDDQRVAFFLRAVGVQILWNALTRGVQREADATRLKAIIDAMRKEICTYIPEGTPVERGWQEEREWTDEEVAATVAKLKEIVPAVWREIAAVEKAGGSIRDMDALTIELGNIAILHPGVDFHDVNRLHNKVDKARRKELGVN